MNINWSPDDSSSFIRHDDESEADPVAETQGEETDRPARRNGLLAIDDSDFEALIEILGTNGDRNNLNLGLRTGSEVEADPRPPQGYVQDRRPDATAPVVARCTRSSNEIGALIPTGEAARASAGTSSKPTRQSSPFSGQAPQEVTVPPRTSSPNPRLPRATRAVGNDNQLASTGRASSPLPSRGAGRPTTRRSSRPEATPGFTQSKGQLGTSLEDARSRVSDLRGRLQILKSEVQEFAPHLYSRAFDPTIQDESGGANEHPSGHKWHPNAKGKEKAIPPSQPMNGDLEEEFVSSLSANEAKRALLNICRTLHLNPSNLVTSSSRSAFNDVLVPPSDVSDVVRTMKLVSDLDELVWRRNTNTHAFESASSKKQPSSSIYDEENVQAILDRIRLWERTARSRAGRRTGSLT